MSAKYAGFKETDLAAWRSREKTAVAGHRRSHTYTPPVVSIRNPTLGNFADELQPGQPLQSPSTAELSNSRSCPLRRSRDRHSASACTERFRYGTAPYSTNNRGRRRYPAGCDATDGLCADVSVW